jgi:hypothetical protein
MATREQASALVSPRPMAKRAVWMAKHCCGHSLVARMSMSPAVSAKSRLPVAVPM